MKKIFALLIFIVSLSACTDYRVEPRRTVIVQPAPVIAQPVVIRQQPIIIQKTPIIVKQPRSQVILKYSIKAPSTTRNTKVIVIKK